MTMRAQLYCNVVINTAGQLARKYFVALKSLMNMPLPLTQIYLFRILFVFVLMAILVLATFPSQSFGIGSMNDKLNHFAAFYVCALLVDFSFPKRNFGLRKSLFLLSYGLLIESVQLFISYRFFSPLDLLADAGGILFYSLSQPLIRHVPILKRRWVAGS